MQNESKAKGGFARAVTLTPRRRQEIARKAALARWDADVPQATHEGEFALGNAVVWAAVLPNGKRLLAQASLLRALGRSRSPKAGTGVLSTVDGIPFFLQADALKPFISEDLLKSTTPIFFRDKNGRRAVGYDAELLPMVAEVYLRMRDAYLTEGKAIPRQYAHIIEACDAVIRGLARVGIIALVDEATGYQDVRDRLALQAILDQYLRKEFAKWAKQFPPEFYQGIFRLRGWQWRGMKVNPPQIVAHYTKDLVYARLAPGIVKELEIRNPMTERGYRKHKHYQYLTEDIGLPALAQHLYAVNGLMRASATWKEFMELMDKAHPRRGDTLQLHLFDGDNFESVE
jgi:P63C domain